MGDELERRFRRDGLSRVRSLGYRVGQGVGGNKVTDGVAGKKGVNLGKFFQIIDTEAGVQAGGKLLWQWHIRSLRRGGIGYRLCPHQETIESEAGFPSRTGSEASTAACGWRHFS